MLSHQIRKLSRQLLDYSEEGLLNLLEFLSGYARKQGWKFKRYGHMVLLSFRRDPLIQGVTISIRQTGVDSFGDPEYGVETQLTLSDGTKGWFFDERKGQLKPNTKGRWSFDFNTDRREMHNFFRGIELSIKRIHRGI